MGSQLLSYHNLYYMMKVQIENFHIIFFNISFLPYKWKWISLKLQLSRDLHTSIIEGRFPEYVFLLLPAPPNPSELAIPHSCSVNNFMPVKFLTSIFLVMTILTFFSILSYCRFVCNFLRIMVYFFTSFTQIGPFSVYILYLLIGGIFPILCHCIRTLSWKLSWRRTRGNKV